MNILKRIIIILMSFFVISMVGYCADSNKVYHWNMGSIFYDPATEVEGNENGMAMGRFIELVEEKTDGHLIIKPFYASVLGGQIELSEQISTGQLECCLGMPVSNTDIRLAALNIPYLFNDYEEIKRIVTDPNGALFKLVEGWLKESNTQLVAIGPANIRGFANNKHTVRSIKDLKDLKVRTYQDPIVSLFWSGICIAQPLSYGEAYSALQSKTVDGMEHPISTFLGGIGEFLSYYTNIDWQWCPSACLMVNQKVWNELPADFQKLVKEAAIEALQWQGEIQTKFTNEAYEVLKERGYEITILTPEEKQEWVDYGRSLDEKIKKIIGEDAFNDMMNAVESAR